MKVDEIVMEMMGFFFFFFFTLHAWVSQLILRLLLILCVVAPVLLGVYIARRFMMCSCSVVCAENVIRLHLFILLITWCQDFGAVNLASSQVFIVLRTNVYTMVAHTGTLL